MKKININNIDSNNSVTIEHLEKSIIINSKNDKLELIGDYKKFNNMIIDNLELITEEILISEKAAFTTILKLTTKNYPDVKIVYTAKYEANTLLDIIRDFSKNISKNTEFEIHCTGDTEWVAKTNKWLIYGADGNFMAAKKPKTDTLNTLDNKFEYLRKKLKEQIKKMSQ
jgi:hypothetical protein